MIWVGRARVYWTWQSRIRSTAHMVADGHTCQWIVAMLKWGICHDQRGLLPLLSRIWGLKLSKCQKGSGVGHGECEWFQPKREIQQNWRPRIQTMQSTEDLQNLWGLRETFVSRLQAPVSSLCGRSKVGAEVGETVMMWSLVGSPCFMFLDEIQNFVGFLYLKTMGFLYVCWILRCWHPATQFGHPGWSLSPMRSRKCQGPGVQK